MTEDARERAMREPWFRAWDKWSNEHDGGDGYYVADGFEIGYGIAKREDEQRIADLVAALVSADSMMTMMWHRYRSRIPDEIATEFEEAMRAVVSQSRQRALGQSEEVKQ